MYATILVRPRTVAIFYDLDGALKDITQQNSELTNP